MKIGEKELKDIKDKTKKRKLDDILKKDYPYAEIFVIRGFDRFSYENYTKDAFFDKDTAYNVMSKIPPNGSPGLCDTYHVHSETTSSLNQHPWDDIDRMMIYEALEENYIKEEY